MNKIIIGTKIAIISAAALVFSLGLFLAGPASGVTSAQEQDSAPIFKAKCAMCHGPKAEKHFDGAKTDDVLVETLLKGKDGAPKMPSYEKSFTPDQAKAMVAFMKTMVCPPVAAPKQP